MTSATLIFAALVFAVVLMLSLAVLSRWLPDPGRDRLARLTAQNGTNTGTMERILRLMAEKKASDVYMSAGSPVQIKINGVTLPINSSSSALSPDKAA